MKLRVLQVAPSLHPGGAERVAVYLACGLNRERFETSFVSLYTGEGGELAAMLRTSGVALVELGKRTGFDPSMYGRLRNIIRIIRPHVVHTHLHVLHYTALPAWMENVPAQVHTVHSLAQKESAGVRRCFQKVAFRRGVVPVAVAAQVACSLRDVYGIEVDAVAPNGICVEHYRRQELCRQSWRNHQGFAADDVIFVCVGRLAAPKGHQLLLQSFARAFRENLRARLVLAGDGPLRAMLESEVDGLGLRRQVRFLGTCRDIPEVLAASDVFVLASFWEGNPLAVMEAMAAGKPVIATSAGGVPELVHNGTHGLLVEPGDAHNLAEAMRYLFDNPVKRRAMGKAGADRASRDFDVRVMVNAYQRLYESLIGKLQCAPQLQSQNM